jgi:hypothetical protein
MMELMDGVQPAIATGPNDPRWGRFLKSIPSFMDFWESCRLEKLAEEIEKSKATSEDN